MQIKKSQFVAALAFLEEAPYVGPHFADFMAVVLLVLAFVLFILEEAIDYYA